MSSNRPDDKANDVPEFLVDTKNNTTYERLRYFGKGDDITRMINKVENLSQNEAFNKLVREFALQVIHEPIVLSANGFFNLNLNLLASGGFAKCYEIKDMKSGKVYAGKIVSKKLMMKHNQKEKMSQEILIHQTLSHKNIVTFLSFFDDVQNIYIVLELCKRRSMMELHKRRRVVTDYECRFYIFEILEGVKYLHDNRIIHRDLKLGNLFLNDMLNVKIGDFGLATRIDFEGERKKTLCGTPNYIAPEILSKKGHSFEVDIWSIGCVMYTLLVGQPPFETKSLKDTYSKIKKCDYRLPQSIRKNSAEMIVAMLQSDPEKRPSVHTLCKYEFLTSHFIPKSLPTSCLTMAPRADQLEGGESDVGQNRKPLHELNDNLDRDGVTFLRKNLHDHITASGTMPKNSSEYKQDVENLFAQLTELLKEKPNRVIRNDNRDEYTDPAAQPLFWISKWVDYSDKYGFGYQLCDEGMGVMFNDTTKLIMLPNGINVHFVDKDGQEAYMTATDFPPKMDKKMKLLSYFKRYMIEHLIKAGGSAVVESDTLSRIPHLHTWFRTACAVVMHLTNGSVQLNFSDHMKIILCPRMSSVTCIDSDRQFRTYRFSTLSKCGISNDLYQKLRYAHEKLKKLIEKLA